MLGLSVSDLGQVSILIGAFLLSWILGFIVPGAPGGIGVREAALTLFVGAYFPTDIALFGIVIYRLINVLGDFIAFAFSTVNSSRILKKGIKCERLK